MLVIGCGIYLGDYYHGDMERIESFVTEHPTEERTLSDGVKVYSPEGGVTPENGFIFYPGGKVEAVAYEPLLKSLASEGMLCVLVEMPFNLAVFDMKAAEGIPEQFPEVGNWYLGGHSLGGSMAASYLADHVADYEGLILLGSYSTADLSKTGLSVLSVYGSEDKVLNKENYEADKTNLPADFTEIIIEGGCHAQFGMYGVQDGDGVPTISNEEQIGVTVDAVMQFFEE
ncbi:MAG: alpha/beta hydrolase [Lachnospiraceae bacterium]|nr:alpha/beta hydrolase [Lachnospiraceae bacterium]